MHSVLCLVRQYETNCLEKKRNASEQVKISGRYPVGLWLAVSTLVPIM